MSLSVDTMVFDVEERFVINELRSRPSDVSQQGDLRPTLRGNLWIELIS